MVRLLSTATVPMMQQQRRIKCLIAFNAILDTLPLPHYKRHRQWHYFHFSCLHLLCALFTRSFTSILKQQFLAFASVLFQHLLSTHTKSCIFANTWHNIVFSLFFAYIFTPAATDGSLCCEYEMTTRNLIFFCSFHTLLSGTHKCTFRVMQYERECRRRWRRRERNR